MEELKDLREYMNPTIVRITQIAISLDMNRRDFIFYISGSIHALLMKVDMCDENLGNMFLNAAIECFDNKFGKEKPTPTSTEVVDSFLKELFNN